MHKGSLLLCKILMREDLLLDLGLVGDEMSCFLKIQRKLKFQRVSLQNQYSFARYEVE